MRKTSLHIEQRSLNRELPSQLLTLIKDKQTEILRMLNGELITMFWEIGEALHIASINHSNGESPKDLTSALSKQLPIGRDPYFSVSNLNAMVSLYRRWPARQKMKYISSLIGWDQLKVLLRQENEISLRYYLWLTVDKGLTASALQRRIASKQLEAYQGKKNLSDNPIPGLKNATLNDDYFIRFLETGLARQQAGISAVPNLLKQSSFRRLISSSGKRQGKTSKEMKPVSIDQRLLDKISQVVHRFRETQHTRLNAFLNTLFWNVGKIINENLSWGHGTRNQIESIREISRTLEPQFGKNFKTKNLLQFSLFHQQVPDLKHTVRLSYLLPFNHIVALLSVPTIEAKLFYARIAATEGLSISELRKRIAMNGHLIAKDATKREERLIAKMKNPITKTATEKKGNSTVSITSKYIDFGDDLNDSLLVRDVFKHSHFMNFVGHLNIAMLIK